ncbi:MAG: radical SAM protein [Leptolyngbyaceae cyanobacterium]
MKGTLKGTETVTSPLQESALSKKGLCDYVINIASGCLHGCTFCYVPSTPAIRTRQALLSDKGVKNPQMDWGKYLFLRNKAPEQLSKILEKKRTWKTTNSGKGVVLLCSGTDPYQNSQTAFLTRKIVKLLIASNKRVRILTRSPLWTKDLDVLSHPNITIGMSLPHFDDSLSKLIEPSAPPPSVRFKALLEGRKAGCRLFIAAAPTPPSLKEKDFTEYLEKVITINPEIIFWEPINARGTNGSRMQQAGISFVTSVMTQKSWAHNFLQQWEMLNNAAQKVGCLDKLHIWPDKALKKFTDPQKVEYWINRPTIETWST